MHINHYFPCEIVCLIFLFLFHMNPLLWALLPSHNKLVLGYSSFALGLFIEVIDCFNSHRAHNIILVV